MYVPSLDLGLSHPFSCKRVCPPPGPKGGGAHSPAAKGVGESQFQRLEKRLALCLLCGGSPAMEPGLYLSGYNSVSAGWLTGSKSYRNKGETCTVHCTVLYVTAYTVIRFVWVSAKFGTCNVVSVNGTLVEDKIRRFKGNMHILDSTGVQFTLTTVQVPNLTPSHKKRITVYRPKLTKKYTRRCSILPLRYCYLSNIPFFL